MLQIKMKRNKSNLKCNMMHLIKNENQKQIEKTFAEQDS